MLLKPGRLSEEEFDHIKEHPLIGASILQAIPSISDILPVACFHHERMDGKGYPQGLLGQSIPLWARMTSVADTCDALTSDRPYRKGRPMTRPWLSSAKPREAGSVPTPFTFFFNGAVVVNRAEGVFRSSRPIFIGEKYARPFLNRSH